MPEGNRHQRSDGFVISIVDLHGAKWHKRDGTQPRKGTRSAVEKLLTNKSRILTVIGIAIGLLFLWLAFRNTDISAVSSAFGSANLLYVPLIVLGLALFLWAKTLRWALLLEPLLKIPTGRLFPITVVGYASNIFLPAQLGELVRTYLASKECGLRAGPVLVTVVLERMFDFLTILAFVAAIVPIVPETPDVLVTAAKICGGIGAALLAGALSGVFWPDKLAGVFKLSTAWLPGAIRDPLHRQFELAMSGLQSLSSIRMLAALAGTSLIQWLLMGLCTWFAILAFDIDVPVSAAYVVLAVVVVGMTIPSSPGFFGTIQLCFTIGLGTFGVHATQAVAASILYHGVVFVSFAIGGVYYARRLGYSATELVRASEADPE